MIALIDGDVLTYSCGFAAQKNSHKVVIKGEEEYGWQAAFTYKKQLNEWLEFKKLTKDDVVITTELIVEPVENALHLVKKTINSILEETGATEYIVLLTGKDNFREKIATIAPYKGNRDPNHKPHWYQDIRTYLIRKYNANIIDGQEADDAMGILQYQDYMSTYKKSMGLIFEEKDRMTANIIICSIDKDMNMIPGWHYNFKEGRKYWIDEKQAIKNFYLQLLTGDKTDNIIGIPGIGPVKAAWLLEDCNTEVDMYWKCFKSYEDYYGDDKVVDSNMSVEDILNENAQLLWIRREKEQQWQPPTERH